MAGAKPNSAWGLHDAAVDGIELDWAAGRLEIRLTVPALRPDRPTQQKIVAEGVVLLSCPRREPWGPSRFINAVSGPTASEPPGATCALRIEMQSGDEILVEARAIALAPLDGRPRERA